MMKSEKRNVLRACILTMLLAMPVAGSYASTTLWTEGTEISGDYNVVGRNHGVTVDKSNEEIRAAGNVNIENTVAAEMYDNYETRAIIGGTSVGKSLAIDMGGHDLTAGDYGAFINLSGGGSNNTVTIANADNIVSKSRKASAIFATGTGQHISLDAKKNIELNKIENDYRTSPVFIRDEGSLLSLSAGQDILVTNGSLSHTIELKAAGTATIHANHDVILNQEYGQDPKYGTNEMIHSENQSQLSLSADHDIRFNNKGVNRVVFATHKAIVDLVAGNDIIYHNQQENANPVHLLEEESKVSIEAGHDMILKDAPSVKLFDLKGTSSVEVGADHDIFVSTKAGQAVSLIDTDGSSKADITAGHDMTLAIGAAAPVVHAKGQVNLKAGNDMTLSMSGADASKLETANLYADGDKAVITAEATKGTLIISNDGAVGAYADGGRITFGGAVVMETGNGAVAANNGTIFFKGPLTITGTETGLRADDSTVTVEGEAVLNGADGALAENGGTILFNGPLTIHSTATGLTADGSNITVGEEAFLKAADGVVAFHEGTILFEGPLTLKSRETGLTTDGSTITLNGAAVLDGADGAIAENGGTILFKGPLTIHSTGAALQAADGGIIDATAADTDKYIEGNVVADGGSLSLDLNTAGSYLTGTASVSDSTSRTGTLDLTIGTGTVWNVTGDSSLTNLTNNGSVNMADRNRAGQQLTAKTLAGTGTLVMDLDWLSNQGTKGVTANSDYVTVTDSATGKQALVSDPSAMNLDKMGVNDRLYVAALTNSDATLTSSIQQRNVHKGHLYDYLIGLTHETTGDTTDWYFSAIESVESPIVPAADVQNRTLFDMATNMDTLNKRLGEARYTDGEDAGLWARLTYRHLGRDSYDGHSNRFELGYDKVTPGNNDSTLRQGVSFSYLRDRTSFTEGTGKYKGYTGSFYQTRLGQFGHYLDIVGRIGRLNGEGTTRLINGDESKSSFGTWYQQASVEWGRKKALRDSWYIEPQSQLQYTHINGTDYRTSDGIKQNFDSVHSLIGRLGFRLGKDIDATKSWYFKADVLHEFAGNRTFDLTSVDGLEHLRYDKTNHDTWYDVGAGITAELSHDRSLWLEFERTFNGSYGRDWELNGGMTWRFH